MGRRIPWIILTIAVALVLSIFNGLDYTRRLRDLSDMALKGPRSPNWPGSWESVVDALKTNQRNHVYVEDAIVLAAAGTITILVLPYLKAAHRRSDG